MPVHDREIDFDGEWIGGKRSKDEQAFVISKIIDVHNPGFR